MKTKTAKCHVIRAPAGWYLPSPLCSEGGKYSEPFYEPVLGFIVETALGEDFGFAIAYDTVPIIADDDRPTNLVLRRPDGTLFAPGCCSKFDSEEAAMAYMNGESR